VARLSGKQKIDSIFLYLKKQGAEASFREKRLLRIAALTVHRAYYTRDRNAFQNAHNQVMKEWAGQYEVLEQHAPQLLPQVYIQNEAPHLRHHLQPVAFQEPRQTVYQVDGRNGRQWLASIVAYLEWRSGSSWRPQTQRFHEDKQVYVRAIRLLNTLSSGNVEQIVEYKLPLQPVLPPKKPAASVPAKQLALPFGTRQPVQENFLFAVHA
jgi:hypothetical protein